MQLLISEVVPGTVGNALFFSNFYPVKGNFLRLGKQSDDCTGLLQPGSFSAYPCEKGHTISLWVKILSNHTWGYVFQTTTMSIVPVLPHIYINVANGTHFNYWRNTLTGDENIVMNQWHHVGLTISERFLLTKYIDSQKKPVYIDRVGSYTLAHNLPSTFGCRNDGTYCRHYVLDEFRVWKEKKDDHFMWLLANSV